MIWQIGLPTCFLVASFYAAMHVLQLRNLPDLLRVRVHVSLLKPFFRDAPIALLFGRKKNMIVTAEGKNIYPEDIENTFEGIPVKEFCVFAVNYVWPQHTMTGEQLVLVLHPEPGQTVNDTLLNELSRRNAQLLNYKRVSGYVIWDHDFTRNAAMKIRRVVLAEQISKQLERNAMVPL